jgi:hypothetical protein
VSDIGGPNVLPAAIALIIVMIALPFLAGSIPFGRILGRFGYGAKIAALSAHARSSDSASLRSSSPLRR